MKKNSWILIVVGAIMLMTACTNNKITLPDDVPKFVEVSDIEAIDWDRKAEEIGNSNIIGNENKSGVIGADMPSLDNQKWMWHLWGVDDPENTKLTAVGFHRETETVHPILIDGWTRDISLGGPNNGADAHVPSSVKIPEAGEWAILLYTKDQLFDTLIYEIEE